MPRDASGQRTADTSKGAKPLPPATRRGTISVPASYMARKQWEAMQRERVLRATQADVARQPADNPIQGTVAVMPRDERQAKDGNPLMLVDVQPGKTPVAVIGMGAVPWQDLKDMVDEHRWYGFDKPNIPKLPVSYEEMWQTMLEKRDRAAKGKHTYGATTRGLL